MEENFNENTENYDDCVTGKETEMAKRNIATKRSSDTDKKISNKFQCKHCDKSYIGRGALINHIKSVDT